MRLALRRKGTARARVKVAHLVPSRQADSVRRTALAMPAQAGLCHTSAGRCTEDRSSWTLLSARIAAARHFNVRVLCRLCLTLAIDAHGDETERAGHHSRFPLAARGSPRANSIYVGDKPASGSLIARSRCIVLSLCGRTYVGGHDPGAAAMMPPFEGYALTPPLALTHGKTNSS